MDRDLLPHLPVVAAVARRKGFAAAAAELGVPLFARTTRSVALTQEGAAFVAALAPALNDIGAAWETARAGRAGAAGLVRINTPRVALPLAITAILADMVETYPDVVVEAYVDDGLTDIVAAGFDAGVRLGEMIAQDMATVRLTPPFKAIVVAAPAYLRKRGAPRTVGDLAGHDCIGIRFIAGGGLYAWELLENGRDVEASARNAVVVNDPLYGLDLALAGVGLAYVYEPIARPHLQAGRLAQVLEEAAIEEPGLFLYFPVRARAAPKLRAVIEAARRNLRALERG